MARKPKTTDQTPIPAEDLLPEDEHPDYLAAIMGEETDGADDDALEGFTPVPGGPVPDLPLPGRPEWPGRIPRPLPDRVPRRPFPLRFCGAVSGRYRYVPRLVLTPRPTPMPLPRPSRDRILPQPTRGPVFPINQISVTVRVDVDRFFPQNRISIEVTRRFPRATAHAIAEVTSDSCHGLNTRTITAGITYRDGPASLIPGDTITFRARRGRGAGYGNYAIELSGGGISPRTYTLSFDSDKFDPVEFEVDQVANAGAIVTSYATADHPTRPADLPAETLTLATVFERAGFDVAMSPNTSTIPTSGAGANGTWSDAEMHNAMVTYWSRFDDRARWAMWVLYAARHDMGRGLGGIMFDDIGPNHRQGTAIFTDSFIQDVPPGDPDPAGWRRRMEFWTAVHEIGHGFNLAHSWQKGMGVSDGAPGDPWIPLVNDNEARSFMNYPFRVSGGQSAFFGDFRFRFTDEELVFMRHAPRRFVQMGNSNWFVNHGFEAPDALMQTGRWRLEIRPNRAKNVYRFLEPVTMELKLTNAGDTPAEVEDDFLQDGAHVSIFVGRDGGETRRWRPMVTRCHESHDDRLEPGESIFGAHQVSASTNGWLIDEPGFYKLQAAVDMGDEVVVSNVLRLWIAPPADAEEMAIAPDWFTEDVARSLAFSGAPALETAQDTLRTVAERCGGNPAARHADLALTTPGLTDFKVLDAGERRTEMAIRALPARTQDCAKAQTEALLENADAAADTIGHIPYFERLRGLAEAMEASGDDKGAVQVMRRTIDVMKTRDILGRVIENAEARLKRRG